ncbi:hypothetical protein GF382_03435 [Candidatus Falkowbacteria bacterium]|nr:hypothetical protein [Candidatus Falkowbacteria bacterium]
MKEKTTQKYLARNLRKRGASYSEILKKVNVSKSTLSLWLRDIELTNKQKEDLVGRRKSRHEGAKANRLRRIDLTKKIIASAKEESLKLKGNSLFLLGVMLYWAEGTKRGEEMVVFSNSDPNMILLMMKWFREICKVKEEKFRIQVHIHSLHKKSEIIKYWSNITKIKSGQFHKLIIKKTSLKHRKNKLYQGTCCIRIYDKNLFRRIMGWKVGILESFKIKDVYNIPR